MINLNSQCSQLCEHAKTRFRCDEPKCLNFNHIFKTKFHFELNKHKYTKIKEPLDEIFVNQHPKGFYVEQAMKQERERILKEIDSLFFEKHKNNNYLIKSRDVLLYHQLSKVINSPSSSNKELKK